MALRFLKRISKAQLNILNLKLRASEQSSDHATFPSSGIKVSLKSVGFFFQRQVKENTIET